MRGTGKKTSNMDMGKRNGLMAQLMKANMSMERKSGRANLHGRIQVCLREISKMLLKGLELTHGLISVSTLENGKTTKCTGRGCSLGLMDVDLKGFT